MRLVPIWSVNFTAGLSVNQPSQDTEVDTCQQLKHKAFVVLDFFLMVSYILYILKSQAVELHGIITPCSYIPSFYFVNAKTVHLWVTIKMNMFPSSSFCQQTMQTFTCYSQLWQAAWKTGGSSFFSPPIPAVTNQVCCCGTIKKQVKGMFLISDKVQRLQKQSWMINDAKASIYSQNKGKSQILKTSEYFNQLQKSHWYYFPHLKKGKYKLRNVKGSYWFFSDGFSSNSNRNASVAQKCPNTHHLSLIWRFTNLICK